MMTRSTIDHQILDVVKKACPPQVVRGFTDTLKRAEKAERTILIQAEEGSADESVSLPELESLDQIITACQHDLGAEETLLLVLDIGDVFKSRGDLKRADDLYAMVIIQAYDSSLVLVQGEAHLRRGEVLARQGRWQEASAEMRRSRQIFESIGKADAVGRIDNLLGTIAVEQGNIQKAREYFQKALEGIQQHRQSQMMGMVLMNLGIVQNILGQHDDALKTYAQAKPYLEKAHDKQKLASLDHNIGMSLLSRGDFGGALRSFDKASAQASRTNNIAVIGLATLGKATLYFRQRNLRLALRYANAALEQFIMVNDRLSVADTYKLKGMIHRESREFDLAESYLLTSLRLNLQLKNQLNAGETYFEMGVLETKRGNVDEALMVLESARACFGKVGARIELLKTVELMGQLEDHA